MSIRLNQLAVDLIACPYCNAQPGEPCVTRIRMTGAMDRRTAWKHWGPSGRSNCPHSARTRPIYEAWQIGYREGRRDATTLTPP